MQNSNQILRCAQDYNAEAKDRSKYLPTACLGKKAVERNGKTQNKARKYLKYLRAALGKSF
jgi:hypothetical protein